MPNILKLETGEELFIDKEDESIARILAAKIRVKRLLKPSKFYCDFYCHYFPHRNNEKGKLRIRQLWTFRNVDPEYIKELESLSEFIIKDRANGNNYYNIQPENEPTA